MQRRSVFGFLLLNVIVTVGVVSGLLFAYNRLVPPPTAPAASPLVLVVTSTANNPVTSLPAVTVIVVTATPNSASATLPAAQINPPGAIGTSPATASIGTASAIDAQSTAPITGTTFAAGTDQVTAVATQASTAFGTCIVYTVKSGDVPSTIASQFNLSLADLYNANGLHPDPVLHIGQTLIIPGPGCDTPTPTPTSTLAPSDTAAALPSSTPIAVGTSDTTAATAITITQVIRPGDITAEGVSLHNASSTDTIDLTGWTIDNGAGQTYTFPTYRLFPNGDLLINTRTGDDTPRVLFWGLSSAVWGAPGATVTLKDAKGTVQASFTVGS